MRRKEGEEEEEEEREREREREKAGEGGLVSDGVRFTSSSFRRRSHE